MPKLSPILKYLTPLVKWLKCLGQNESQLSSLKVKVLSSGFMHIYLPDIQLSTGVKNTLRQIAVAEIPVI